MTKLIRVLGIDPVWSPAASTKEKCVAFLSGPMRLSSTEGVVFEGAFR